MAALRIASLSYWYPDSDIAALDTVTWSVDSGITVVGGPSGSGKSTLLRVCNGLVPHFHGGRIRGQATVAGRDILRSSTRELAQHVGFLFQDPELQAVYATVERDVAFGLENLGVPRPVMHQRVDQALHRMGIEHLRDRAISTLSGGERQRCALAGVLAMRPGLVVLDEPFSQLDTAGAAALTAILQHLRDDGIGCIVAEHRRAALEAIADSRMTMNNGAVHQVPERTPRTARAEPPAAAGDAPVAWTLDGVIAGHGSDAVLHDVSLRGRCGEVTLLTGANGSGKTTLLRTIAGLMPPLAGSVERAP
ncbi:MAG: ABC transporter ATP-binding protein, partial [Candidatus Dormibacteraeota bacterium]|nr:ABC transporter ATP-binding protein [Candidatus Dormibacteraeota bacterium]